MKKRSLTENVFFNMLYQVLVTVLPVITTPYTARALQLHANSIHSFTESIVTYFIILGALGTSLYGIRKVACVRDDEEQLASVTKGLILLRLLLLAVTLAVYVPLLCIGGEFAYIYRIQIINIIANGIDVAWFYQGVEDFKKVTLRNLVVKFIYIVCLFTFINSPDDLPLYVFMTVGSAFFGNAIMLYYLPRYVDLKKGKTPEIFSHLKPSLILLVPQAMNYIYALIDRSMLGWLTETDNVGIYDYGQRIARMITGVLQSVGYVMMARVANLTQNNDREGICNYVHKSVSFTWFIAIPAMFGILGVADDFIPLFLGEEYLGVVPVLKILSVLIFIVSMNSLMGVQMLIPLGMDKIYTLATTVGAVVSVVGNLALVPFFEVYGACIACLIAEGSVFALSYWNLRNMFDIKKLIHDNYSILIASVVMYGVVRLVALTDINIYLKLLLELGGGVLVYTGIVFLAKNETAFAILEKIKGFLSKFSKGKAV